MLVYQCRQRLLWHINPTVSSQRVAEHIVLLYMLTYWIDKKELKVLVYYLKSLRNVTLHELTLLYVQCVGETKAIPKLILTDPGQRPAYALKSPVACVSQCIVAKLSSPALPDSQVAESQDWQTAGRETCHHLEHHRLPVTATAQAHRQNVTSPSYCARAGIVRVSFVEEIKAQGCCRTAFSSFHGKRANSV